MSITANTIEAYRIYWETNSFTVAAKALFLWDFVITFDREVRYVWGRRPTIATVLFMVNRYINLSATIFQLFSQSSFVHAKIIISSLIFALFFSLRIYATWGRDWRPALPIFLLALVPPAANMLLTPFRLMLILNVAQIIVASMPQANNALSYFITPLTSILVSRFLLNLRRLGDAEERERTSIFVNTSIFSARQFHSEIIGNLGEELDYGTSVGSTAIHSEQPGVKRMISQDLSTLEDTVSGGASGTEYELSRLQDDA
ncbi:hypothetical protein EUX98_g7694 [Antrodiella citrinella]|uniref:DUF6533 domain-containing protein n=1 Tax=Antrodiella citrinella TaxID=2447956 RepID=A0A4V3XHT3_9APHY|nr:hypothetical protein EUX98_g7694 [Antrodiella citrinella]